MITRKFPSSELLTSAYSASSYCVFNDVAVESGQENLTALENRSSLRQRKENLSISIPDSSAPGVITNLFATSRAYLCGVLAMEGRGETREKGEILGKRWPFAGRILRRTSSSTRHFRVS